MITAKQIADWASTGIAQNELPRLVRRLIHATATTTQIAMPAGDSTSLPGLDGELFSEAGNSWVPKGHSCWEASCRADATTKANEDYQKRVAEIGDHVRLGRTYVAVTARKWPKKEKWKAERTAEKNWLDVRAYDADDLEHWLEQSPTVALAFAEELGLHGPGVISLPAYYMAWSTQCAPAIAGVAVLIGRDRQRQEILKAFGAAPEQGCSKPLSIKADSVDEAVAFVAALILAEDNLADRAVVVTDRSGWRFVDKNIGVRIAVAARPEIAETPSVREGLVVVVPYASGDMERQFGGVAGRLDYSSLDRADHSEFEKALRGLGIDENNSRRLSLQCGRSWSIFRRQHATNPSVRRPAWLDHPSASALATLCLIGSWSSSKEADKEAVSKIAGRTYDELERDLRALERLEDSPVLHIGMVWKAKSALELLALFGDRITDAEIDRFFAEAGSILSAPDPQLELDKDKRYAASIYGKTRPFSGLLIESICDTLIKLAVRGPDVAALAAKHIGARVDAFVRELLQDADATRWLSLASQLPALAEAGPEVFLSIVESSMSKADAPVVRLLTETDDVGPLSGRCWHAGLLWALEVLAWAPQYLGRVSLILARLSYVEIKGNWGNTPDSSLVDLYRSWFPQTGANIEQRIKALDLLVAKEAKAASGLLDRLTGSGLDSATHTARPKWRDDDSGAGYGATNQERYQMLVAAADRQLRLAPHNVDQIVNLVGKYDDFDDDRRRAVLDLISGLEARSDDDKETIRSALRDQIHWHRNHGDQGTVNEFLRPLKTAYEKLEPHDLVIRHGWLFKNGWVDLPIKEEDYERQQDIAGDFRKRALTELFAEEGWNGLLRLANHTGGGWLIGPLVVDACTSFEDAIEWLTRSAGELERGHEATNIAAGFFRRAIGQEGHGVIQRVFAAADRNGRDRNWKTRLILLAPEVKATWDIVEALEASEQDDYWRLCTAQIWDRDDPSHLKYALEKLLQANRPVTALKVCRIKFSDIDPEMVMQMLEGFLQGIERDASLPASYYIQHAIDHIESSDQIDRMRLAKLEFGLIRALGHNGGHHAVSLYTVLMSQPEVFIELLCLLYKPKNGVADEGDENKKFAAENAWTVLHACARQPGTLPDGTVTADATSAFVNKVRELAKEADRLEVCDSQLGEIIARGQADADGVFPSEPFRDVFESVGTDQIFNGFEVGCFNKRGVHSRGPFDGGDQERDLAAQYRRNAQALQFTHPRLAASLENMAKSYDRHGHSEDLDARLRREGH